MFGFKSRSESSLFRASILLKNLCLAALLPLAVACTTVDLNTPSSAGGVGVSNGVLDDGVGVGGNQAQNAVQGVDAQMGFTAGVGPANIAHVLYFDLDSYAVSAADQALISAHARFLAQNKARSLILEGHTDERGGREYNLALGQKRADAVAAALRLLGADSLRLEAISYGEEKPELVGQTEEAFSKNRRVVLRYR